MLFDKSSILGETASISPVGYTSAHSELKMTAQKEAIIVGFIPEKKPPAVSITDRAMDQPTSRQTDSILITRSER